MTTELTGSAIEQVAHLATEAAAPTMIEAGVYLTSGGEVIDVREQLADLDDPARPRRAKGTQIVNDATAFVEYVNRHRGEQSEVWANPASKALTAVLNGHETDGTVSLSEAPTLPGHRDWRVQLALVPTEAWARWTALDRKFTDQVTIAELLEDRLADIIAPPAADLLELAQTFQVKRDVAFESSRRLSTGETVIEYRETDQATAGKAGKLDIPESFTIRVVVYEGSEPQDVTCRLRYRLTNGELRLAYVIDQRPAIEREAFDALLATVRAGVAPLPVWLGQP